MEQSLRNLEPPLVIDVDIIVKPQCLDAANDGWPNFMHTLATKYFNLGRPREAESLIMEVLSFREARQREDCHPIINTKRTLAWIMADQGRREEAEELQRSLLKTCQQAAEIDDNLIAGLTNDLSLTLSHRDATPGKIGEAITLLEQIIDAWKTPEGEETEKSLTVASNLAVAYMNVNRLEEAEAFMLRVITGSAILHGENSQLSLEQKNNLGQLLARQHKWAESEAISLEVLEVRKRTFGMDDPFSIQAMSNLGWVYSEQGRFQEAKELQLEVLDRRMKLQGTTHPDTINILGNLALTSSKLGEKEDARRYARMALGY